MVNQLKEDTMPQRRVLITGASKGIGRAVADRVAAAGHLPIGLARTGPEDFPGEFYEVDLADRAATAEVLEQDRREREDRCRGQQRRPRAVRPNRLDRP